MENKNTDILELFELKNSINLHSENKDNSLSDPLEVLAEELLKQEELENESNIIQEQEKIYLQETQINISQEKVWFLKKALNNLIFIFKYISTSALIFAFLLSATNYSAYVEIARSYLSPESLEENKLSMLASVNWANLSKEEIKDISNSWSKTKETISLNDNSTYHSMDKLVNSSFDDIDMNIEMLPYENRIVIPKIWKNIPLVDVENRTVQNVKELEDVFMNELANWIVRYPGSARPGEVWNSFIFGHSSNFPWIKWDYNDVFALLDNLEFWDEVIAYYWQKKYTYKIKEKNVIKPGDVSVLKRDNWISEISLMTCWPVWTTLNRMIVVWELVKE